MSQSGKPDNLCATLTALCRLGLVLIGLIGIEGGLEVAGHAAIETLD